MSSDVEGGNAGAQTGKGATGSNGLAGGILERNDGALESTYFAATTSGVDAGVVVTNDATVESSYWDHERASGLSDGDGVGSGDDGNVTALETEEMQGSWAWNGSDGNMSAFDFSGNWSTVAGDYPDLKSNPRKTSTPHESAPGDAEQATILDDMDMHDGKYNVTSDKALQAINRNSTTRGWDYRLVVDVDANGTDQWNGDSNPNGFDPIGESSSGDEFTGTFDGDGHTISDLYIDRGSTDYVGLFGYVDGGTVEDVGVENVDITGNNDVGGLVGQNSPGNINDSYASGDVSGSKEVGGLVGYNVFDAAVTESYATGDVSGTDLVGGFAGSNYGTVSDSYWDDEAATVEEGGTEVTDQGISDGSGDVTGLTTAEMQGQAATDNLGGFGFVRTWHATSSYPAVAWEDTDPFYGVAVESTTSPVDAGETLDVTANVTNWGADGGSQTVTLTDTDFSDSQQDSQSYVELDSGESTDLTLSWSTSSTTPSKTGDVTVASDAAAGTESVTVDYYADGDGSESDPYEIENWYHLDNVRQNLGAEFVLTADLDSNTAGYDDVASDTADGFDPVGDSGTAFTGEFDGANYTISNLTIDRDSEDNVGLFGIIDGGTVRATVLDSPDITGDNDVGGIVGNLDNDGTVTRSSVHGGSVVVKETDDGSDPEDQVGGIVGVIHDGTLSKSTASVDVGDGTGREIGGLVGDQAPDGTVENVSFTGSVDGNEKVGGILGDSNEDSTLNDAFVAGSVSGDSNSDVGAVIGREQGGSVTVTDSYWDADTTGVGSGIGAVQASDDTTELSTSDMQNLNATVHMHGLDFFDTWMPRDGGYPEFTWDSAYEDGGDAYDDLVDGDGTRSSPYAVTDVYELQAINATIGQGDHFELQNDIEAENTENWYGGSGFDPIGHCPDDNAMNDPWDHCDSGVDFSGNFSGNTYEIANVTIDRVDSDGVGLFGVATDANFENIRVKDITVKGDRNVGGLVGDFDASDEADSSAGTVVNVSVTGTIDVGIASNPDGGMVGGIVGRGDGTRVTDENVFRGNVTGGYNVGGLQGRLVGNAKVSNGYTQGNITATTDRCDGGSCDDDGVGGITGNSGVASTIENAYSAAEITAVGNTVGAIVGQDASGTDTLNDVYWDEEIGPSNAHGGTTSDGNYEGLKTSEIQDSEAEDNMNLDWKDTWQTVPEDYPLFQWEAAAASDVEISGTATHARNGTKLSGVTVESSLEETTTDSSGGYTLNVSTFGDSVNATADSSVNGVGDGFVLTNTSDITDPKTGDTLDLALEPRFNATITDTTAPVTEGETLNVTAEIKNTEPTAGTENVTLVVDGEDVDSREVDAEDDLQIAGGDTETVTLEWETAAGLAGSYNIEVATESSVATEDVEVDRYELAASAGNASTGLSVASDLDCLV